ncbi:sterol O-acyltransferase 1 [Tribolium castaneum]|uniref:O-acyltransferase n=1 Tax=Tribolium castaneum TaxID=7070 RepID=D6WZF0_TRICA|nr:PREDICTED: sterol O-acyltransferase 1 [Tribolium castaneum]XP_969574.1 PREDICTED: sterol O-acyltransferase 1 [Tribolium castaneum]EFA09716.1 Sterol O-acyltransferase 1-like Protein [Tribolium castaneum]|eukprot:XP_008198196.1 PREDICTED: sterol O-acyltransferase 1 [Tribolium castaneum]
MLKQNGSAKSNETVKQFSRSKEKEFSARNSLLTDLFENKHIRTVYHMFIATLIGLFVNTAVYDYFKKEEITFGVRLIKQSFGKIHIVAVLWLGYFTLTCLVYHLYKFWAQQRVFFPKLSHLKLWNLFGLTVLGFYYISMFTITSYIVTYFALPPASACIVLCEQTRFLMKIHSFVRNTCPRKPHTEPATTPNFRNFLYFLFVPTLVYRETYPRREKIDWTFVCFRVLECVGVLFFMSFVIDRFLNPTIQDFGLRPFTVKEIILGIFENTITGALLLLPMFFIILHSWQNLCAELTRFGDRLFYLDWWTCTDYSGYFRKWNIIVQDWLYLYVYRESSETVYKGNLWFAKFAVFLISAIVHEWILTFMFGFFFPLLFVEFLVFGSIFNFLGAPKTPLFNILFWYSLCLGVATLVTMYGIEFYARINAPLENPTFFENLLPRFLTCDCLEL